MPTSIPGARTVNRFDKGERFATVVTAGCALWNVGLAFVVGLAVLALARKGWLRL